MGRPPIRGRDKHFCYIYLLSRVVVVGSTTSVCSEQEINRPSLNVITQRALQQANDRAELIKLTCLSHNPRISDLNAPFQLSYQPPNL